MNKHETQFLLIKGLSVWCEIIAVVQLNKFYGEMTGCYWLPRWLCDQESDSHCRRPGFDPWVGKIPERREWLPTPVFLPGKSHGQRSLAGYVVHGVTKELDMSY